MADAGGWSTIESDEVSFEINSPCYMGDRYNGEINLSEIRIFLGSNMILLLWPGCFYLSY